MGEELLHSVERARRGDRRAFEALYERFKRPVLGYLTRMLGNRQTAEDVMQETWIKVFGGISRYRPEQGSFRAWLFRIAGNAALDRLRRERSHHGPERPEDAGGDAGSIYDRTASGDPGPDRVALGRAEIGGVAEAMGRLPERQRTAILLRHQQGLSYREIAAAMDTAEGTAKTLVHRGVFSLRRMLGGDAP